MRPTIPSATDPGPGCRRAARCVEADGERSSARRRLKGRPGTAEHVQARHRHRQGVFDIALTSQHFAVMQTEDREELAHDLNVASAGRSTWTDVHAVLFAGLTYGGVGEDHGTRAVAPWTTSSRKP